MSKVAIIRIDHCTFFTFFFVNPFFAKDSLAEEVRVFPGNRLQHGAGGAARQTQKSAEVSHQKQRDKRLVVLHRKQSTRHFQLPVALMCGEPNHRHQVYHLYFFVFSSSRSPFSA